MPPTYPDGGRVLQLLRGGSWNNNPRNGRWAYRNHNQPDNANNNVGFRVACNPQAPFAVRTAARDSNGRT
jgi:formylglycine-generating enzyme required for sulfatase activity